MIGAQLETQCSDCYRWPACFCTLHLSSCVDWLNLIKVKTFLVNCDCVLVLFTPESLVRAEAHTKPDSLAMQGLQSQPSQSSGHQYRLADASTANAGTPMLMWPKGFLIAEFDNAQHNSLRATNADSQGGTDQMAPQ